MTCDIVDIASAGEIQGDPVTELRTLADGPRPRHARRGIIVGPLLHSWRRGVGDLQDDLIAVTLGHAKSAGQTAGRYPQDRMTQWTSAVIDSAAELSHGSNFLDSYR